MGKILICGLLFVAFIVILCIIAGLIALAVWVVKDHVKYERNHWQRIRELNDE